MLTARNGANKKILARICADTGIGRVDQGAGVLCENGSRM